MFIYNMLMIWLGFVIGALKIFTHYLKFVIALVAILSALLVYYAAGSWGKLLDVIDGGGHTA